MIPTGKGDSTRPAVFLDRDGTINAEKGYVYRPSDWEWLPGSVEAIARFNRMGFLVVVVTNQAGIARGLFRETDVRRLHDTVNRMLAARGSRIDAYYICPHHPDFGKVRHCPCRKPSPGLLFRAQRELGIDLRRSYLIGDKASDIAAGRAAGVTSILVGTGYGSCERSRVPRSTPFVDDLLAASEWVRSDLARRNPGRKWGAPLSPAVAGSGQK